MVAVDVDRRSVLSGAAVVGGVAAATLLSGTSRAAAAVGGEPLDATTSWSFVLTVGGIQLARFPELLELSLEVRPAQDAPTGGGGAARPATVVPPTIRLRRTMSASLDLSSWHEEVRAGQATARRSCTLQVLDHEGQAVLEYLLTNAWPTRLETGVAGGPGSVLTETVTLTAERVTRRS